MLAIFLPVRLFFYTFVTHGVLPNLGMMSSIAVIIFILIEKNKLGWFGIYFKNRVRRLVFHKILWVSLTFTILTIAMYGYFLIQIDKVQSGANKDEIDFYMSLLVVNFTDGTILPDAYELKELGIYPSNQTINLFVMGLADNSTQDRIAESFSGDNIWHFVDLMVAVSIYEWNESTNAWGSHFMTVILVEQLESIAVLFFYRKVYFKKGGASWQSLGLYPKNIKKMVRAYNAPTPKKVEVY